MNLPENIKRFREIKCITQGELAAILGIHQSTLSEWESGRDLRSSMVPEIATALGVTPNDLYGIETAIDADSAA